MNGDTTPFCVFCDRIAANDVDNHGIGIYSFEPLNPVVPGHRLFVAQEHFAYPHHNPAIAGLVFGEAARLAGSFGGDYNLIVNGGRYAGQTVSHLHVHYVPRWPNDGLLLPWGGVKS
jgi:diadenosine tetraphosphate (Ap4A) HIT family hydrolase